MGIHPGGFRGVNLAAGSTVENVRLVLGLLQCQKALGFRQAGLDVGHWELKGRGLRLPREAQYDGKDDGGFHKSPDAYCG